MSLYQKLLQRQQEGRPIRVGLIGAGKFGSMYLAQAQRTPGIHLVGVAGGSFVALDYAAWHPERLLSLVFSASTGSIDDKEA